MRMLRSQWDRVLAWVAVALGALLLLLGWIGVSGTGFVFEQLPYVVSGGIGGLFLLGIGAMSWISADLRDEWRKLDRLEHKLGELASQKFAEEDTVEASSGREATAALVGDVKARRPRAGRVRREAVGS